MGRLCTPGGAVVGIVGGGMTFRFLNGEAILDENMLFWVRLYALVVVLKILLDFRLYWWKSYGLSEKKRSLWGATSLKQIQEITPPGVKFVGFVLTSQGIWNVKVCHHLQ